MKITNTLILALSLTSCTIPPSTLKDARSSYKSNIIPSALPGVDVDIPPKGVLEIIDYPSAVGNLKAYLTPNPKDKKKQPAIIWVTGGDCNSIGDVWTESPIDNDQNASAFRDAGIIMMYPSLRGGNRNPGQREGFLGEVDDVISAFNFLKSLEYVDSTRIYLGGHSTGGTLVLLTAELSNCFAGIISFGPVSNANGYGSESNLLPYDVTISKENEIRSPLYWLADIKSPTIVFEGSDGNTRALDAMQKSTNNPNVRFFKIPNGTHFSILHPINIMLARAILNNTLFNDAHSISEKANEYLSR